LLNLANAFSGGLFLSVGLCHLLPEVQNFSFISILNSYFQAGEVFEGYFSEESGHYETEETHEHSHEHLPWANLLCFLS